MNSKVLEEKKVVVAEIREKLEKAQSVVLVDYRGLTVEAVTELRDKYREANVDYKVYKNSLMRFAFNELGITGFDDELHGPNAIAISYDDAVSAARITNDFAKQNENLTIKLGYAEDKIMSVEEVKALASIPSKEVLYAQLAGVLQGNIRNLAYLLDQVAGQDGEVAEAPVEEAPVETEETAETAE